MTIFSASNSDQPVQRMNLSDLAALLLDRRRLVYGLIVSRAIYDDLRKRAVDNSSKNTFETGNSYSGIPMVIDPALADSEFDAAFTREAWIDRLQALKQGSDGEEPLQPKED